MNPKLREHLSLRRYRYGGGQYNINSSEESGQNPPSALFLLCRKNIAHHAYIYTAAVSFG